MQKILNKYPFLKVTRGFEYDTIKIVDEKTGLELSREDKKYIINKVYDELMNTHTGYMSIEVFMGTMLKLNKW